MIYSLGSSKKKKEYKGSSMSFFIIIKNIVSRTKHTIMDNHITIMINNKKKKVMEITVGYV